MERERASSIELVLDAAGEEAVRGEWAALEAAGLSSMGAHRSPSNRPHVTLLAAPGLPVPRLAPTLPIALRLGPPELLPGDGERRVLARPVERAEELLALRAAVVAALAAQEPGATWATWATDAREAAAAGDGSHPTLDRRDACADHAAAWLPHVTLAKRLRASELPRALRLLGGPIEAAAVGLRHWDPELARTTALAGP
ncbi:hypothetical protein LG314_00800 [Agrococcus terreus]|uniref:hypothetical protein n=1 Tax=Agrococcus terreus TaxID=574649 RepID=UPI00384CFC98